MLPDKGLGRLGAFGRPAMGPDVDSAHPTQAAPSRPIARLEESAGKRPA
jgi:hypothetical protein